MATINDQYEENDFDEEELLEEEEQDSVIGGILEKADSFTEMIQPIFDNRVDENLATNYLKRRKPFGQTMTINFREQLNRQLNRYNEHQNLLEGK